MGPRDPGPVVAEPCSVRARVGVGEFLRKCTPPCISSQDGQSCFCRGGGCTLQVLIQYRPGKEKAQRGLLIHLWDLSQSNRRLEGEAVSQRWA